MAESKGQVKPGTAAQLAGKSLEELQDLNVKQGWGIDLPFGAGRLGKKGEITTKNIMPAKSLPANIDRSTLTAEEKLALQKAGYNI
jgi:hypothetical protein